MESTLRYRIEAFDKDNDALLYAGDFATKTLARNYVKTFKDSKQIDMYRILDRKQNYWLYYCKRGSRFTVL